MLINRRGLLIGLGSALAAPAIVSAANLMLVHAVNDVMTLDNAFLRPGIDVLDVYPGRIARGNLLSINMITREAIKLWTNSNEFIRDIDRQYDEEFFQQLNLFDEPRVNQTLRIRLPDDYRVEDRHLLV